MKKIAVLIFFLVHLVGISQKTEYYRFSFDYFIEQLEKSDDSRKYFIKKREKWLEVFKEQSRELDIDKSIDWKIEVDEMSVLGAFSENGVYEVTADSIYEKLKEKWKHMYYKPIWEIRARELGIKIEYNQSKHLEQNAGDKIFDIAENPAEFPGGSEKMYSFLLNSISLKGVYEASSGSKAFVQFVIQKNGQIGEVEIIRGVNSEVDKEVKRVIKSMPNWIPARQKGKLVSSRVILPIRIEIKQ